MKTSKEMQLKILNKMIENIENGGDLLKDIQYRNRVNLEWDERKILLSECNITIDRIEIVISAMINGVIVNSRVIDKLTGVPHICKQWSDKYDADVYYFNLGVFAALKGLFESSGFNRFKYVSSYELLGGK